ncbi:hypothetical protein Pmar_PMAR005572, partial [Perkinsus marinus ATCC 50983]
MDVMMGDAAAGGEETATADFTEDFRPDSTLLEKGKADPSKGARQPSKKKRGTLPPLDSTEYDVFKRYFNTLRSEEGHIYTLPTSGAPLKCVWCKSEEHGTDRCPWGRCGQCGDIGHGSEKCEDKKADEEVEAAVEESVAIVLGKGTSNVSKDEAAFVLDSL